MTTVFIAGADWAAEWTIHEHKNVTASRQRPSFMLSPERK
jgi:hypothetical protein